MGEGSPRVESLRVLLVDDEESLRIPLQRYLRRSFGFHVDVASSVEEAMTCVLVAEVAYDVALIDDLLTPEAGAEPEPAGISLLRRIKSHQPDTECIVFTGWGMERALEALQAGAYRYLSKPLNLDEVGMTIRTAAEQGRLKRERDVLSAALEIGNAMVSAAEAGKVLAMITEAVARLTGADSCAVALVDPEGGQVRYEPVIALGDPSVLWHRHLRRGFLTGQIVDSGELVRIGRVADHAEELDAGLIQAGVESFVGVPIPGSLRNLGVLYAYSLRPDAFESREEQVLALLAQQAGIALENAQLLDSIRQASDRVSALNRVVLDLGKKLDRQALLRQVIQQAVALLQAEGGGIYLLDPAGEYLTLVELWGLPLDLKGVQIGRHDGLAREILDAREPRQVADYRHWPDRLPVLDDYGLAVVAGAPIQVGERLLGTLVVHRTRPRRTFNTGELALLQQFANHAGLALQKTELLDTLRAIQEVAAAIARSREYGEVLDRICQAAVELFGVEHSGLVLYDPNGEAGVVRGEYPSSLATVGTHIPVKGVPGEEEVASGQAPLVIFDVAGAGQELGPVRDILLRFDIRSILIVPILYQGRPLGSFSLDAVGRQCQFSPAEVELCRALAAQVAATVENARLMSELAEAKELQEALIQHAFDAVIAIDQENRITIFNQRAEEMFGWTAEEMVGHTVLRLHRDRQKAEEILGAVEELGEVSGWEVDLLHRDGTPIPALLSATLIQDRQGQPIGQAGFMRDLRQTALLEDRLRALVRVSQAVTSVLNVKEALRQVMASAVDAFPAAQYGGIHLYDDRSGLLQLAASLRDYEPEAIDLLSLRPGEGIAGWVFKNKRPTVVEDVYRDGRYKPIDHAGAAEQRSMICAPLTVRGRVIGTLTLDNPQRIEAFQADDLALLSTFADQAAIAIDNARLYQEAQRRERLLAALDEASRTIRAVKEEPQLLHEIVRLAVKLMDCGAGCLYVNHLRVGELELVTSYGLPEEPADRRLPHTEGLVGLVARTGKPQIVHDYAGWGQRANTLKPYGFRAAMAVPLGQGGVVEAVLLVASTMVERTLTTVDEDVLCRFADQAAIALHTSQMLGQEQRRLGLLRLLHEVSDYYQSAGDLDKILQVALTTVTAGYGLGFNRAALLLLDDRRRHLLGSMGMGHYQRADAERDWAEHHARGLESFRRYRALLDLVGLPLTPVGERIREVRLPFTADGSGLFWELLTEGRHLVLSEAEAGRLPAGFVEVFEPSFPLVVAPLRARGQPVGVLIADNRITKEPVTPALADSLLAFLNTTAVAIANVQLFDEVSLGRERLRSFYEASSELVSSKDPFQVLQDIVERARRAAGARGVCMILIDGDGGVQRIITAGQDEPEGEADLVREDGLSMEVMRSGKPIAIDDVELRRDRINPSMFWREVGAALCLPVTLEGKRIGVMWAHYEQPRSFSEVEIEAMQLYVNKAALAYEGACQLDQVSSARDAARAVAQMTALGDREATLQSVADWTRRVTGCDAVTLYAYDEAAGKLDHPPTMVGVYFPDRASRLARVEADSIIYTMLRREAPYIVEQAGEDGFFKDLRFTMDEEIASCVAMPLHAAGEKAGVMFVNYRTPHCFAPDELSDLELFANQAAVAIRNAQLYRAEQRHIAALMAIQETSAAVSRVLELDALLPMITERAALIFEAPACSLMLWDRDREYLVIEAACGLGDEYRHRQRIPHHIVSQYDRGEPGPYLFQIGEQALGDPDLVQREGLFSVLVARLDVGGELIGVLNVYSKDRPGQFSGEEMELARILANHAAIAIHNARLYQRQLRETERLALVNRIAAEVGSSLELEQVLQALVNELASAIAVEQCAIAIFDERREYGQVIAEYLEQGCVPSKGTLIPLQDNPAVTLVCEVKGPLAVKEAQHNPIMQAVWPIMKERRTQSIMIVPIVAGDDVIGTIGLDSVSGPREFSEEEQRLALTIAHHAAIAIEKAQRYEDLRRIRGLIGSQTVLEWIKMVGSAWQHSIRREVGTGLVGVELVRRAIQEGDLDKALAELKDLEARIEKMKEILITPPLSAEDEVRSLRVNQLVGGYLRNLWTHPQFSGVELRLDLELELDRRVTVRASEGWLRHGLKLLVDNAVQAMLEAARVDKELLVSTLLLDGMVQITIHDSGPGIPAEIRGKLFEQPIDKPQGSRGAGVGLMLARTIFEAYDGTIKVGETGPSGTTMLITLPVERGA